MSSLTETKPPEAPRLPQSGFVFDRIARLRALAGDRLLLWAALITLILLGAALRLHDLESQSLWRDEGISWSLTNKDDLGAVLKSLAEDDLHPPLYFVLLHLSMKVFGDSVFALRLLSAISGILLIPVGYALGRRLYDRQIGLLNMLVIVLSPFLLRYSQEARHYNFLALVAAVSLYCTARWFDKPARRNLLFFVLAATAMIYTHSWGFFFLAALNLYVLPALWFEPARRRDIRAWVIGNVAVGALFLPWLPVFIKQLGYSTAWITTQDSPPRLLLLTLQAWAGAWSATPFYVGLLGLAVALSYFKVAWPPLRFSRTESPGRILFLLTVCLAPLLIALAMTEYRPIFKPDRYTIVVYPAFSLLLAVGLALIPRQAVLSRRRMNALSALAVILLIALWARKDRYYLTTPYKSVAREAAADVAAYIEPDDVLVFTPDPLSQSFLYYYRGDQFKIGYANWGTPTSFHIDGWVDTWFEPDIREKTLAQIDAHLGEDACLWLVYEPGDISVPDAEDSVDRFLEMLRRRYVLQRTFYDYQDLFEHMQVDQYCGKLASLSGLIG